MSLLEHRLSGYTWYEMDGARRNEVKIAAMRDVVKRYGSTIALDHVDLELQKGEILGLLGPNGAGKTTAIHALVGLLPVDGGAIELFEQRQHTGAMDLRRRVGLVTQEITIFEDLTARENLQFFAGLYGIKGPVRSDRIRETLEFVGLTEHADKLTRKFSGGMKRRLNIACALTHKPELLVMDEPTVGIDPQSRNHIIESVRALRDAGTTILYTTHYMEEAQAIASRIVIMDLGHVIAQGTVDELIERIQYEERVLLEVGDPSPRLIEVLRRIAGVKEVRAQGARLTIVSQAGAGNLDRVLACAQSAGGVRSVTAEKPSLEDVFLALTGKSLRDGEAK
jgi:ABC-2 type transport system ATP-binding protein